MTEVHFYHLTRSRLEQVLPDLLEKTLARGWKAVVMAASTERVEALTQSLWLYQPDSFLPHGSAKDGLAELQPIWLTDRDERPNDAQVLFLTDGMTSANLNSFERVCDVFEGIDDTAVAAARDRWKAAQAADHTVSYWKQTDRGWEKAA